MQRCNKCKKLRDEVIQDIELKIKKAIKGDIYSYDFSPEQDKVAFFTSSYKYENLYLYNIKSQDIFWSKRIPYRPFQHLRGTGLKQVIFLEDRIVGVISSTGVTYGQSFLLSFNPETGGTVAQVEKESRWTNAIRCKQRIVAGSRNGYIYSFDKDLKITEEFCLKGTDGSNRFAAPYHIVSDKDGDYIAFAYEQVLFLFDQELKFLWSKNISSGFKEFRFIGNSKFQQEKYIWACQALDIGNNSTVGQIKNAFRKKALQWHPDRHTEEYKVAAEEKFKDIVNAYELLTNISEEELSQELIKVGGEGFIVRTFVYGRIGKIGFLEESSTKHKFVAIFNNDGIDSIFDLTGIKREVLQSDIKDSDNLLEN
jgi:hypothetical protein